MLWFSIEIVLQKGIFIVLAFKTAFLKILFISPSMEAANMPSSRSVEDASVEFWYDFISQSINFKPLF